MPSIWVLSFKVSQTNLKLLAACGQVFCFCPPRLLQNLLCPWTRVTGIIKSNYCCMQVVHIRPNYSRISAGKQWEHKNLIIPHRFGSGKEICTRRTEKGDQEFPQKRDLNDHNKWHKLQLLSVPRKFFCGIILNTFSDAMKNGTGEQQAGFYLIWSWVDQSFTLYIMQKLMNGRPIIEICMGKNKQEAKNIKLRNQLYPQWLQNYGGKIPKTLVSWGTHVQLFVAQESPSRNWTLPQIDSSAAHWFQTHLRNSDHLE